MSSDFGLDERHITSSLHGNGLLLAIGPVVYRIKSKLAVIAEGLRTLYFDYPKVVDCGYTDHEVSLNRKGFLANLLSSGVNFRYDHTIPFGSMSKNQAYAFLEWGMNWCIAVHHNEYLKLHAAVLARNGKAVIMPGQPGAGKSTLSAALMLRGWRLLSDEHALIQLDTPKVVPICRPVSLKNESIDIIRSFDSGAVFGPESLDTHKGKVAHLKADLHPDSHKPEPLDVVSIIFPSYVPGAKTTLTKKTKAEIFMRTAEQSFNYSLHGLRGFHAMKNLVSVSECSELVYSDLDSAVQAFEKLELELQ